MKTISQSRIESPRIGRSRAQSKGKFAASLYTGITIETASRLTTTPLTKMLDTFDGELNLLF
jgi:hypothetical protein